jgi:CRP/FNR family transcriptional regulator, cyclic AMP receptor protein
MAARKLSPKTGSNMTGVPSKRSFSGILPNLPIQFSESLLANAKPRSLAEREVLFEAGDVADGCYRLEQGVLKVSIASPQGDERILTILGPGSIVGELAIIDGLPRSATVVAIRDCKLSFISREAFVSCLREYPEIYSDLVSTLVSRLREADRAMAAASFLTVKARVARAARTCGASRSRNGIRTNCHPPQDQAERYRGNGGRCARKRKSNPDRTEAARIDRSIIQLLFHQRQAKASARDRRYRVR